MNRTLRRGLGLGLLLSVAACGGTDVTCLDADANGACGGEEPQLAFDGQAILENLDFDLGIGSRGPEVRAVNEYLMSYGYFPNAGLQREFPAWRPLVTDAPTDLLNYDEVTSRGISALQVFSGLRDTGIVDQETRELLRLRRCGVPDGVFTRDPDDKYSLIGQRWGSGTLRWRVTMLPGINPTVNGGTGNVAADVTAAANRAFGTWGLQSTSLQFSNPSSGAIDIQIAFSNGIDPALGSTQPPGSGSGGDITLNNHLTWSVGQVTPASDYDLETTLLHEIGHALGLNHSALPARMQQGQQNKGPFQQRVTTTDDNVGISVLFDQFEQVTGSARDIAVGADAGVWIISNTALGNGNFTIQKRSGGTFVTTTDGGGVRIAVGPSSRPWVIAADGSVWRRTTNRTDFGVWEQVTGCATDIGASNSAVWILGCSPVSGGFRIYKWDEATAVFVQTNDGAASRIAVDVNGAPWVIDSSGAIYWRSAGANGAPTSSPNAPNTWTRTQDGLAKDIGIGPTNYPWVLGTAATPGGFEIYAWDNQAALPANSPAPIPAIQTWLRVPGGATAIAVDSLGKPWVVNNTGAIFRHLL
jgi:hypothetical protein